MPLQEAGAETFLQPLQGWRILIDPGTGRELIQGTPVKKAIKPRGVGEAVVNMRVALFLSDFLKNAGAEVMLSRKPGEVLRSLDERLKTARDFKANLILSIHHNYGKDTKTNFAKVYYYPPRKEPESSIARHIAGALAKELNLRNLGPEVFSYPLLTRSQIPAVMISCGCITNPRYEKKLKDLEFNRLEAIAILKGMMNFQEELSKKEAVKPPMPVVKPAPPSLPSVTGPLPRVPFSKPPMPQPLPIKETLIPSPVKVATKALKPFNPPLLNPVGAQFDQSWLFGESWGDLPIKNGVSFIAPAGTPVKAAADGVVMEASAKPPTAVPEYPNCVILKHVRVIPQISTIYTIYGKLASIKVKKGDKVKRGDVIGTTGAPYSSENSSRDTELEFEVRCGNINQGCIVNPELFTEHTTQDTGIIIGKLIGRDGKLKPGVRIDGASKPPEILRYSYSLTYGAGIPPSDLYKENFVIGDVVPGDCVLTCDFGVKTVKVEAGRITLVTWKAE